MKTSRNSRCCVIWAFRLSLGCLYRRYSVFYNLRILSIVIRYDLGMLYYLCETLIRILPWVPLLVRCRKTYVRACQDSQDGSKKVNRENFLLSIGHMFSHTVSYCGDCIHAWHFTTKPSMRGETVREPHLHGFLPVSNRLVSLQFFRISICLFWSMIPSWRFSSNQDWCLWKCSGWTSMQFDFLKSIILTSTVHREASPGLSNDTRTFRWSFI